MGYDAWLEAPYQQMMEESDRFYDWCESEGFNLDDDEDMAAAEAAYQAHLDAMYEDWAEAQYEREQDRMMDEYYEREEWF